MHSNITIIVVLCLRLLLEIFNKKFAPRANLRMQTKASLLSCAQPLCCIWKRRLGTKLQGTYIIIVVGLTCLVQYRHASVIPSSRLDENLMMAVGGGGIGRVETRGLKPRPKTEKRLHPLHFELNSWQRHVIPEERFSAPLCS